MCVTLPDRLPCILVGMAMIAVEAMGWHPLAVADDPPAIHPFGKPGTEREDAIPGWLELSNDTFLKGRIFLTRDMRLKIYDAAAKRQREIPLQAVRKIECEVAREWMEKEWRFKENANDEKLFTGRTYPAREYRHTITLQDERTMTGPMSAVVYIQEDHAAQRKRFLLHKRQKGSIGSTLESLVHVRRIELGYEALETWKRRDRMGPLKKPKPSRIPSAE